MGRDAAMTRRLEKHEQADGVRLLQSLGARVYVSGTARRAGDYQGTNQTPGIPDVEAFLPPPRVRPGGLARQVLKWECKRPGGKLSAAQRDYADLCRAAAVAHVSGDLNALIGWLVSAGYLRADQLPYSRQLALRPAPIPAALGGQHAARD
jgi:hypothetical protein